MAARKKQVDNDNVSSSEAVKRRPKTFSSEPLDIMFLKNFKHSQIKDPDHKELSEFDDVLTGTFVDKVCVLIYV